VANSGMDWIFLNLARLDPFHIDYGPCRPVVRPDLIQTEPARLHNTS
jgi:hypothetical protein